MLSITDLRTGTTIELDGDPHVVLSYSHNKMGRGGAVVRTRLKNLKTSATYERSFHGNDKVEEAHLEERSATFLYQEGSHFVFMDSTSFEQFNLTSDIVASAASYLIEGATIKMVMYEDSPIGLNLPIKMDFRVVEAAPGVKGDTAQGGTKPAKIETGATVIVPLFVNTGDLIRVDTRDGSYIERVKE